MKVVIVGGVAGGASAAARIRRLDETAEIIIFERSGYISYANCGLPYYIGNVIKNKEDLTVQTVEGFEKRFNVDVRVHHEVIGVDPESKMVTVRDNSSGNTFEESYDKLLLSPGAKASKPEMKGINLPKIFTIRTVEDTLKIKDYIEKNSVKSVSIIGGGFIGIEMAENLSGLGLKTTLIEYADHLMAQLDGDMSAFVHSEMRSHGIKLMLSTAVTGFEESDGKIITVTANDEKVKSDIVILAIGVIPDTSIAETAGLKLGIKNSIVVNDRMETSNPDIYAVGDAVQVTNYITESDGLISLAGPANKQGRIAADNICGGNSHYHGTQGTSILKLFERTIASTGINETTAKKLDIEFDSVILSPMSHASYYPGGGIITLKILFEKHTEHILGAQIVGFDGVDKRIDVIATAIRGGIKATALAELELAYAPPFSSAKDPVNMAGFIIENIITDKIKQVDYYNAVKLPKDGNVFLLDVRTPAEYSKGFADGFINIPLDELRSRINEIPENIPVYVMCQTGLRSYIACRILCQNGYDSYNFKGGYFFYNTVKSEEISAKEAYACGAEKVDK